MAPHQTAVAPTMTTIATATTAASIASAVSTALENSTPTGCDIATTVHRVRVITMSAAQIKKSTPYQWRPPLR